MSETDKTTLGTPVSPRWTQDWTSKVDAVEKQMRRRICGAHSPAWTPCKLSSTHPNGRCRFHGGAQGIGAPNGNRNALIHGLYARRLQRCGMHCPVWQHCPMAGKDVLALDPTERPNCVYEEQEYNALTSSLENENVSKKKPLGGHTGQDVTPADSRLDQANPSRPEGPVSSENVAAGHAFLHHNVAMYQVMLTRAQAALGVARLVEDTIAEGERYSMKSSKVAPLLQAELRIGRELRQWLRLLANDPVRFVLGLAPASPEEPEPERVLGLPDLMVPILAKTEGILEACLEPRKPGPSPA